MLTLRWAAILGVNKAMGYMASFLEVSQYFESPLGLSKIFQDILSSIGADFYFMAPITAYGQPPNLGI